VELLVVIEALVVVVALIATVLAVFIDFSSE
jgi:hypothetical protein